MCQTCEELIFSCFNDGDELRAAVDAYEEAGLWAAWSDVAYTYGYPIGTWCVSSVTDMSWLFAHKTIDENLNGWDVSQVTDMVSCLGLLMQLFYVVYCPAFYFLCSSQFCS